MNEEELEKMKKEIEELMTQIALLREQIGTLSSILKRHLSGDLTINDLQICAKAFSQVQRQLSSYQYISSSIGGGGGKGLEEIIATAMAQQMAGKRKGEDERIEHDELTDEDLEELKRKKKEGKK